MGGEFGIPGGRNSDCESMAVAAAGARRSIIVEKAEVGLHPGEPGMLAADSHGAMAGV